MVSSPSQAKFTRSSPRFTLKTHIKVCRHSGININNELLTYRKRMKLFDDLLLSCTDDSCSCARTRDRDGGAPSSLMDRRENQWEARVSKFSLLLLRSDI